MKRKNNIARKVTKEKNDITYRVLNMQMRYRNAFYLDSHKLQKLPNRNQTIILLDILDGELEINR